MKRTLVLLALATVVLGTTGCGCCRDAFAKKTQPVTYAQCVPQQQMCAPLCAPAPVCAPACVPCDPCGQPLTAGYGSVPSMMSMPQSMPMMAPSDCGCVQ